MKNKSTIIRIIGLIIGLGVFYISVASFGGISAIFANLLRLRFYYLAVILNSFAWFVAYTFAWQYLINLTHKIHFRPLLKIKMCGEAINFMTPLGFVGGDPIRVMLLRKYLTATARLSSVVIDRLLQIAAAQLYCFLGFCLIFFEDIPFPNWLIWFLISMYILTFSLIVSLLVSFLNPHKEGLYPKIFKALNIQKHFPKLSATIDELRADLALYGDKPKLPFVKSFALHFLGRILGTVEILIIVYCFKQEFLFSFAVILTALTSAAATVFGIVPGALGFIEAMYAGFFQIYGLSPELGIAVQVVRRLRTLFWILMGVILIDVNQLTNSLKKEKNKEETI